MAEDPSKSLFTFEHFIIERQPDTVCDEAISAAGSRMKQRDRAGRCGTLSG